MTISRDWHLVSRPDSEPSLHNFALVTSKVPELKKGQVLVKNLYLSVDPYMRGRMNDTKSYIPAFALNETMTGGALGQVIDSQSSLWKEGDLVEHFYGWRELAVLQENEGRKIQEIPGLPLSTWLGALGMPGLTAYAGLLEVGRLKAGERVFVSGAAGAVGSLVGQIAKIKGCFVVGSCGSDDKVRYLKEELGFDQVLNYRKAPIAEQLNAIAGEGIDVYFDNVGGDHLEAAIDVMRKNGRLVLCGAISQYNTKAKVAGPANLMKVIGLGLTLQGFIVSEYAKLGPQFVGDMSGWMKEARVRSRETLYNGIEQAPEAFLGLFKGDNSGKAIVTLV